MAKRISYIAPGGHYYRSAAATVFGILAMAVAAIVCGIWSLVGITWPIWIWFV